MTRIVAAVLALGLMASATSARAQDAALSREMLSAALNAAIAQRDQGLNQVVDLSARLTVAQREIAQLRKDLDSARKAPAAADPAPKP